MRLGSAALALAMLAGGCVQSSLVPCGERACPSSLVCAPGGNRCVVQGQIDACVGLADGAACSYPGVTDGVCLAQVCLPAGCGNGVIETNAGEVCDDENRVSFDGCSADCTSDERCGDGVTDGALNEGCDCGDGTIAMDDCSGPNSQNPGATCRADCTLARCGDGVVDPFEVCDDGNTIPGDGCRADCAGRWTAMQSNTFALLQAVWGTAGRAFAVGPGSPGRILEWDGNAWNEVIPPVAASWVDVGGSGPSDLYFVGGGTSEVYHYNGSSFTQRAPNSTTYWKAVCGRAPDDVWLVGNEVLDNITVAHWNGAQWSLENVPSSGGGNDVWCGPTAGDVYAASTGGFVHHRSAGTWPQIVNVAGRFVNGGGTSDVTSAGGAVIRHFNGSQWQAQAGGSELAIVDGLGSTAGESVAVGSRGRILVCDGTTCRISPAPTTVELRGAWSYEPGRAFVVGLDGTILY